MIRVLIHGCNGRMGNMVSQLAADYGNIEIIAGVDKTDTESGGKPYPVYDSLPDVQERADVIIDVSTAEAVDDLLDYCADRKIPAVICTTGISPEQEARIESISVETAILRSGNMSMGINTLIAVLRNISKPLADAGFDIEIVERHHKRKIDAPSGTAIMLADAAKAGAGRNYSYVYDRSERRAERSPDEIGISAVRGGTIVGEHDVIFAGADEIIEIKHTALSRAVFANGALNAAIFLSDKRSGLYSMGNVIG